LTWWEFKRLFKKKNVLERYYGNKTKELYELKRRSMTNLEYMTKFLALLRYLFYLTNERVKFQRFLIGLALYVRDWIEYDEP